MIGVIADSGEHEVVREFFELFKTPWEFYRNGKAYDVVLCNGIGVRDVRAKLIVIYSGRQLDFDNTRNVSSREQGSEAYILRNGKGRFPIFGSCVSFRDDHSDLLVDETCGESCAYFDVANDIGICRIGYDLFDEIHTLLVAGQPAAHAAMATLERHIDLLRETILSFNIALAEIPPVPSGYKFIACLTHDVDHPSIRRHGWDHTTAGFLGRALLGSLGNVLRGRLGLGGLATNWKAAASLPLVQLGIAKDFWADFADRYREIERDIPSTFFVIPFAGRSGQKGNDRSERLRASKYGAVDVAESIIELRDASCEIGLHGIDAWTDSDAGRTELEEIRKLTQAAEIGVRMHWLYYDDQSPQVLEQAGAAYDSSVGYNDTVGYRAGTMQAYKPFGATHMLELPLHVMDTALFYPAYQNLSPDEAATTLTSMIDDAVQYGGCLTINWHDRSTAPERLWGHTYRKLIAQLRDSGAWFATGGQAIAWFRQRRSASIEELPGGAYNLRFAPSTNNKNVPGVTLHTHTPKSANDDVAGSSRRTLAISRTSNAAS